MPVYVTFCSTKECWSFSNLSAKPVEDFLQHVLQEEERSFFYILCNGRKVSSGSILEDDRIYHIVPRVFGGKGGFGSMLRAIGAQIEKTTSREACRDLSGRRMRDINNEKKLKEWLAKEAEREREKEQRKQDRLAKRLTSHQHKFEDKEYYEQRAKVQEDLEDALSKGLKRKQNKSEPSGASPTKKSKAEWLGVELDSDDLESGSDNEAQPCEPCSSQSTSGLKVQTETSQSAGCSTDSNSGPASSTEPRLQEDTTDSTTADGSVHSSSDSCLEVTKDKGESVNPLPPAQPCGSLEPLDLDQITSSQELCHFGLERLKTELMARGLECGGTLEERAARLFSVKGLAPDEIDPSLLAKSKGMGKKLK
ncbi:LOW QUALITY PROTEIN: splicing regulator SDE2-like [Physella acuta]|uniref:LOW QUALITY PROTEIN: splicing regulator SDE2-like n=1 Tax=Physella acuta TaxID=109671 RepID=UPI0027DC0615|nr:LOW QUALITY PROTEIN: splicing regulator SDE2-like [Physella acuta]